MAQQMTIYVIDDDVGMRESIRSLLHAERFRVEVFGTIEEFLAVTEYARPSCIVVDHQLAELGGCDLLRQLQDRNITIPTIVITNRAEVQDLATAVRQGVLDFVVKPFHDGELLKGIRRAIALEERNRHVQINKDAMQSLVDQLTPRERDVLEGVLAGRGNKVIATDIGISQKTVEYHRKNVMDKLGVANVPDLVRLMMSANSE